MKRRAPVDLGGSSTSSGSAASSSSGAAAAKKPEAKKKASSSVKTRRQVEVDEFKAGTQMSKEESYQSWLHLEKNIEEMLTTHQATAGFGQLYRWVYRLSFNR